MPEHENTGELHESPLDPAEDERIRRLLADVRHTGPMPDAVVARLDDVLAGLNADRSERTARELAPVVELAARRRRTAANLLVAAAAVVAVGFGITQVLPNLGGSSGGDAQEATAGGAAADRATSEDGSRNANPEVAPESPVDGGGGASKSTFKISSGAFGPDVRKVRNQVVGFTGSALVAAPAAGCLAASVEPGSEVVATTYDAAPAALVLRPPSGDVQVVDLYVCGDLEPRRSITLMAP